jgi:hypothetical protein
MPAKLHTICYIHDCNERNTNEFIIKELTAISKLNDIDPAEIVYLRIKVFIPLNQEIETNIENFEIGQVILLKGKFIACKGWYSVSFSLFYFLFSFIIFYLFFLPFIFPLFSFNFLLPYYFLSLFFFHFSFPSYTFSN